MTAGNTEQPIRFEPEEACPPSIALLVGFQGAALVLAPDDTVISRDVTSTAPRDNVVFELGLFMGPWVMLERSWCFRSAQPTRSPATWPVSRM